MRNNKAQFGQLAVIILILVAAIVIFVFIIKFNSGTGLSGAIDKCRLSVLAQSIISTNDVIYHNSLFSLSCSKRYATFYNNHVSIGLSSENEQPVPIVYDGKTTTRFTSLNSFVVNQVIAEEMRICAYEFVDGKQDMFENDKTFWGYFSGKSICFICSDITFDKSVPTSSFEGLLNYTKTTTFDSTDSYFNYLTSTTIHGDAFWAQGNSSKIVSDYPALGQINSNKQYSIVVKLHQTLGKNHAWIMLSSTDELNNYCDMETD